MQRAGRREHGGEQGGGAAGEGRAGHGYDPATHAANGRSRICSPVVSTESRERAAVEDRAQRSYLPAVYGCWPAADPEAPTVLVYGYHDVQPVDPLDAWQHPPFEPTVVGEQLHGRGASDDKGQMLMHLLGVQAHLEATGAHAPAVTVKLLVEGEEESRSPHIAALLADHSDELACDAIVVTDTGMYSRDTPSMCTGMRGMADAEVVFHGADMDLHSGQFRGAVPNPVTELARMLAALHDDEGRVAIPGFYDDVREPPVAERAAFARLPFDEFDAPLAFLGVGLPDDRIHAPNEKVEIPLLHRGAEAAALLWRLLDERREELGFGS
ncbi:MAG: M20/M25/M40 family metallo-hydrolase [Pseudonocardiaceae bacterium]|nr:M20/M25/M40 family metallo-hydrolase [Pseudonocardiaceae bacterium]